MDLGQMTRIWSAGSCGCVCVWAHMYMWSARFCDVISSRAKIWWSRGIISICLRYPALSNTYLTHESPPCFITLSLSDSLAFTHTHTIIHSVIVNPAVCWFRDVLYMADNHLTKFLLSYLSVFFCLWHCCKPLTDTLSTCESIKENKPCTLPFALSHTEFLWGDDQCHKCMCLCTKWNVAVMFSVLLIWQRAQPHLEHQPGREEQRRDPVVHTWGVLQ